MTEIDKTVTKIKKLLKAHSNIGEFLELDPITSKSFNLYLVGRFKSGNQYEQKYITTITNKGADYE